MVQYEKLVRDRIPEILDAKGIGYEQRVADMGEYHEALIAKLNEEVLEFTEDKSVDELADVLEVIKSLMSLPKYSDVDTIRQRKQEERGGFTKRLILTGEK